MGVDIHMNIVSSDGIFVAKNIFEGRNSEWFSNLCQEGYNAAYENLPASYGVPEKVPSELKECYDKARDWGYYDFRYMNVKEFKEWFSHKHPDVDAFWLSTYEKWLYENKGIYPDDPSHYLSEDMNPADYHFVEVTNPYDCSAWLYDYLVDNMIEDSDYITYFFDC